MFGGNIISECKRKTFSTRISKCVRYGRNITPRFTKTSLRYAKRTAFCPKCEPLSRTVVGLHQIKLWGEKKKFCRSYFMSSKINDLRIIKRIERIFFHIHGYIKKYNYTILSLKKVLENLKKKKNFLNYL